ncbi:MAG TPA: hypothetical protein VMT45_10190 [Thermoanaerobaculaceae bacterium]|nr:hypothetical protein [Thermoanaerobaculaceae bacterium]
MAIPTGNSEALGSSGPVLDPRRLAPVHRSAIVNVGGVKQAPASDAWRVRAGRRGFKLSRTHCDQLQLLRGVD